MSTLLLGRTRGSGSDQPKLQYIASPSLSLLDLLAYLHDSSVQYIIYEALKQLPVPVPIHTSKSQDKLGDSALATLSQIYDIYSRLLSDEYASALAPPARGGGGAVEDEYSLLLLTFADTDETNVEQVFPRCLHINSLLILCGRLSDSNMPASAELLRRLALFPAVYQHIMVEQLDDYIYNLIARTASLPSITKTEHLMRLKEEVYDLSCLLAAASGVDDGLSPPSGLSRSTVRGLFEAFRRLYEQLVTSGGASVDEQSFSFRKRLLKCLCAVCPRGDLTEWRARLPRTPGPGTVLPADLLRVYGATLFPDASDLDAAWRAVSLAAPSAAPSAAPQPQAGPDPVLVQEAVRAVQAVFGEDRYSEQFIAAALGFFDGDAHRCLDAMLTDNLPPALQYMANESLAGGEWRRPRQDAQEEVYEARGAGPGGAAGREEARR